MTSFDNQIHIEEKIDNFDIYDGAEFVEFDDDGQPDEHTELQDFYGGDDSDHGQYDEY